MWFIRSRQNYLSRYHAINSYFSRLPNRKIKTFPVPWVYLIPFPAIVKPNFPLSRLKKWQIPRPEKALLDPWSEIRSEGKYRCSQGNARWSLCSGTVEYYNHGHNIFVTFAFCVVFLKKSQRKVCQTPLPQMQCCKSSKRPQRYATTRKMHNQANFNPQHCFRGGGGGKSPNDEN